MNVTVWINFLLQTALMVLLAMAAFGGLVGYALAGTNRLRALGSIALGAFVPLVGILVLAIIALARHSKTTKISDQPPSSITSRTGVWLIASLLALGGVLIAAYFLSWFKVRIPHLNIISLGAWGTFLGAALSATLAITAIALALTLRRPSRISAALLAWLGSGWLFLSVAALAVQGPAIELATSLGALKYTVGDALTTMQIDPRAATMTLPEGIDPKILGLSGPTMELASTDLAASIPHVRFEVGPGWWAMLVYSAGALTISANLIRQRRRPTAAPGMPWGGVDPAASYPSIPSPAPPSEVPDPGASPWSSYISPRP